MIPQTSLPSLPKFHAFAGQENNGISGNDFGEHARQQHVEDFTKGCGSQVTTFRIRGI
jgi:hypothetical protein